jgi:hypothetical protein
MRFVLLAVVSLLVSCGDPANPGDGTGRQGSTAQAKPTNDRDRWQKPEVVLQLIGSVAGVTIADLFAEDGYFTFKLIEAGANVIAVVNEPEKAERLEAEKKKRGLGDERLKIRLVAMGDPGIYNEEAEMAFLAHRFLTIQDKRAFLKQMRSGLQYPRYLVMLEWQFRETPMGPPLSERLPSDRIMDMIGELSEYTDVGAHSDKVPDQVVFLINDYMEAESSGSGEESPIIQ